MTGMTGRATSSGSLPATDIIFLGDSCTYMMITPLRLYRRLLTPPPYRG